MYLLPSTSTSVAPDARLMNSGEPPTDLKARTGLSTPPGRSWEARAKSFFDFSVRIGERQRYQKTPSLGGGAVGPPDQRFADPAAEVESIPLAEAPQPGPTHPRGRRVRSAGGRILMCSRRASDRPAA